MCAWPSTESLKAQESWGRWEEPNPAGLLGGGGVHVDICQRQRLEGTKDSGRVWQASTGTQEESKTWDLALPCSSRN